MKILDILSESGSDLATAKAKLAQLRADLKEFPSTTSSAEHAEAVEEINYKIKDQEKKIAGLEGNKPVNECTDYVEWQKACKKADPDATFTGTKQGAQAVNWNTKNNRVVGEWDGKKGTVKSTQVGESAKSEARHIGAGIAKQQSQTKAAAKRFPVGSKVRANVHGSKPVEVVGHSGNMVLTTDGDYHITKIVDN